MLDNDALRNELSELKYKINSHKITIVKQAKKIIELNKIIFDLKVKNEIDPFEDEKESLFFSVFCHEINQSLSAIINYSKACLFMIKNRINDEAIGYELMDPVEQISVQAEHAGNVIHNMKYFINGGEISVEKSDINALIKKTLLILNDELMKIKLNATLILVEDLPHVRVNPVYIMQVILNLARNSLEALQRAPDNRPELLIKTRILKDCIAIDVIDNGPGISSELENKIHTLSCTTKSSGGGLGLGLCRVLIEAHGGQLSIQKHQPQGSCFTFTLPLDHARE